MNETSPDELSRVLAPSNQPFDNVLDEPMVEDIAVPHLVVGTGS